MNMWDLKSSLYGFFRKPPVIRQIFNQERKNLIELVNFVNPNPKTSLDIGSGAGNTLDLLPAAKLQTGMDISFSMLRKLKRKHSGWYWIQAEGCVIPFSDNCFDFISAIGVMEYIQESQCFLDEIQRILKDNGCCLMTISPPSLWNSLRQCLGNKLYTIPIKKWHRILDETGWIVIAENHSLMQSQFLIQQKRQALQ